MYGPTHSGPVKQGTDGQWLLRRLVPANGTVTLTQHENEITVACHPQLESAAGTGADLLQPVAGSPALLRRLEGLPGVSVESVDGATRIGSTVSLVGEGVGLDLLSGTSTAPAFRLRGLVEGAGIGIALASDDKALSISNTSPVSSLRVTASGSAATNSASSSSRC